MFYTVSNYVFCLFFLSFPILYYHLIFPVLTSLIIHFFYVFFYPEYVIFFVKYVLIALYHILNHYLSDKNLLQHILFSPQNIL